MKVSKQNAKTMRAFGIVDLKWEQNRGAVSIYALTLGDGTVIRVEVPIFGSTESTVLKKAAETVLRDRPVRYA